ncbi:histidine phosphatase family protein [Albibacillus kandeliae]|uniref:histidine phosphatase family protein n=1 Tax=Albibacillus kandeliae TaxID=2174228 RepID=UPI000D68E1B3|nr:histidine phosphatase family protein [Albibacillus kandeliae]
MIRLALLRHGVTPWNRAHRIQGRSDIPLDAEGAEALAGLRLPEPWNRAELWSSPLLRACQSAELLTGQTPRTDEALIEMNWGAWEGLHGADLLADPESGFRDIENWGWDYRPPGGESPRDLWIRLEPWLVGLTGDAVAVCHIGVMRILLARAHDWEFDGPAPFRVKRNRLFVLTFDGNRLRPEGDPVRLVTREDAG